MNEQENMAQPTVKYESNELNESNKPNGAGTGTNRATCPGILTAEEKYEIRFEVWRGVGSAVGHEG